MTDLSPYEHPVCSHCGQRHSWDASACGRMGQSGASSLCVGDRVLFTLDGRKHPGKVRKVYPALDGAVLLEWTGGWPHPFFTGPYRPDELERV